MRRTLSLVFMILAPLGPGIMAQEQLTFQDIWNRVRQEGRSRAASLELRAATIARERADRHIYPRIYLDTRAFNTNDPAQSFMGNVEQRSARIADFLPDRLNNPGASNFGRGTIGMDWSIYEGGAKSALARAQENQETSRKEQYAFTVREEFVFTLSMYVAMITGDDVESRLTSIDAQINEILNRYQIGSAGNPVGYSGLLGMRSLKNRLRSMTLASRENRNAARNSLEAVAPGLPKEWKHESANMETLLTQNLGSPTPTISHRVRALEADARAKENMVDVEGARQLPRIGVYTEASGFGGQRKTASSYNAGFYVTMNLFSAQELGASKQASLESDALKTRARDARLREEAQIRSLQTSLETVRENLKLLEDSEKLLNQQFATSRELFRSGAINLLQFTEVFSRRADLIEQRFNLVSEYTRVLGSLYLLSEESTNPNSGADK